MKKIENWYIVELERFVIHGKTEDFVREPIIYVDFTLKTIITDRNKYTLGDVDEEFAKTVRFKHLQSKINEQKFIVTETKIKRVA